MDLGTTALVFDAATVDRLLRLPCGTDAPAPAAVAREMIFYYGGWSVRQLLVCPLGAAWMVQEHVLPVHDLVAPPGYYRFLFAVPDSYDKHWGAQVAALRAFNAGWEPAPLPIAVTAALLGLRRTPFDIPLVSCRCAERIGARHVGLWLPHRTYPLDIVTFSPHEWGDGLGLSACCRS
jgi:hypothetical protein